MDKEAAYNAVKAIKNMLQKESLTKYLGTTLPYYLKKRLDNNEDEDAPLVLCQMLADNRTYFRDSYLYLHFIYALIREGYSDTRQILRRHKLKHSNHLDILIENNDIMIVEVNNRKYVFTTNGISATKIPLTEDVKEQEKLQEEADIYLQSIIYFQSLCEK